MAREFTPTGGVLNETIETRSEAKLAASLVASIFDRGECVTS